MASKIRETKEKLALIKRLKKDDAWKFLQEIMKEEILTAAYNLSSDPKTSVDELNWRRGALWASKKLIEMPSVLEVKLENDLMMQTLEAEDKINQDATASK
ncbi:MAG: hypothetical protein CMG49_05590 [Candidatus Marinimicrobia bacterium]|nr:hypothetical protein [Candidatus Neomarinimicrobiota bacterium]|tara:strand:+ start:5756 stop:6058 length:303 start_codon:yes stop_codon:yes gene_type:complete